MLASVFNLMQFLSAVFLGRISDRVGRKPVLYLGLAAAATSQTLFGLSKSVGYAVCGGRTANAAPPCTHVTPTHQPITVRLVRTGRTSDAAE